MPRYDQQCHECGWAATIIARPHDNPPCPSCGGTTVRVWSKASPAVSGDEIPGGTFIENLGPTPMYFESKRAILAEAKRRGMEPMVRHVPVPGTDKSPHTTTWAVTSPWQLAQAEALVTRVSTVTVTSPSPAEVGPTATPALVSDLWPTS